MFNKVFTFGCSYSCWRQDFYTGFADIVAEHYNCSLENWSSPGNSNEEIIYGFNEKFFKNEIFDSLILFQSTHLTRTAYWDNRVNDLVSVKLSQNEHCDRFLQSNDVSKTKDGKFIFNENEFFDHYFLNIHNDFYEFKKLFYNLYHIQSSALTKNNKIVFLYFDEFVLPFDLFDTLNIFRPDMDLSSLEWAKKNKLTYSETDFHLSERGNRIYAEKLIDFINKDQSKE